MAHEDTRIVELLLLSDQARETVLDVLNEEGYEYVVTDRSATADRWEGGETPAIVSVPVSIDGVEPLQRRFGELEIDGDAYTVVHDPETVVTTGTTGEPDGETMTAEVAGVGVQSVPQEELRSAAADMLPEFVTYALMTAISAVVATAGVLLDSLGVLIGAMVIAPLIGPPMAMSVATVIDDQTLFEEGVRYQIIGTAVGLSSSIAFALLGRTTALVSTHPPVEALARVSNHAAPSVLLVVIAFCAGVAGAISLATTGTIELVGVMISAAVIPPMGVVGVGLIWWYPTLVLGSLAVVSVNVFSINLAAVLCLWYLGYHPREWDVLRRVRRRMLRRIIALIAGVVLLTAFLTHFTASASVDQSFAVPLL